MPKKDYPLCFITVLDPNLCYPPFLTFAILMGVQWYLTAVLSYTSINTGDTGNLVLWLLAIWVSSSVSCLTMCVCFTYFADLWSFSSCFVVIFLILTIGWRKEDIFFSFCGFFNLYTFSFLE